MRCALLVLPILLSISLQTTIAHAMVDPYPGPQEPPRPLFPHIKNVKVEGEDDAMQKEMQKTTDQANQSLKLAPPPTPEPRKPAEEKPHGICGNNPEKERKTDEPVKK